MALGYFENGEGVPFAVEFMDELPSTLTTDSSGPIVFRIMPDTSLKRVSRDNADFWLDKRWSISKERAMAFAARS